MNTKEKIKAVNEAANRLIEAEVSDSWKGGGDPADIPFIESELEAAKLNFELVLIKVFE